MQHEPAVTFGEFCQGHEGGDTDGYRLGGKPRDLIRCPCLGINRLQVEVGWFRHTGSPVEDSVASSGIVECHPPEVDSSAVTVMPPGSPLTAENTGTVQDAT